MLRRGFQFLSFFSLLFAVIATVLWGRSFHDTTQTNAQFDHVSFLIGGSRYNVRSSNGMLTLNALPADTSNPTAGLRDMIAKLKNEDIRWTISSADVDFRVRLSVMPSARKPFEALNIVWSTSGRVKPAVYHSDELTLLLQALESPESFVAAHYALENIDYDKTNVRREDAEPKGDGSIQFHYDGLEINLRNPSDLREDSSNTHFAEFQPKVDPAQLPAIREQWHRRLDTTAAVVSWWKIGAITGFLPAFWLTLVVVRSLRSSSRLRAGQCQSCGYDLRATPDRCPECGAVPESSSSVTT